MDAPMINGIIRRSALNRLVLSLLVLLVALGGLFLARNTYYNLFSGPFMVTPDDVLGITDVNNLSQYYINITGDDAVDTGYQRVRKRYGIETGHESFVALLLGDRYLLIQTPGDAVESVRQSTGKLVPMPSDVQREVINDILRDYPELDGVFLPFMLDAGDFRLDVFLGLAAGIIAAAGALWGLSGALQYMTDPAKHPIMRGLARLGEAETVAGQIEYELNQDHQTVGKTHLTRNWMVTYSSSSFSAARLTDIVWLYHKVTQHRTNGIPTGKSFDAMIWDKYGTSISIRAKEKQVLETLDAVAQRAPWSVMGFKPEIEKAWKSDRQGFLAAVEQRKQKIATL